MRDQIKITNVINPFNKEITVSADKSISIRCVLLASQAIGVSKIYNLLESEDVINSLKCIEKLGIKYKKFEKYYKIYGYGINGYNFKNNTKLFAGNSGTLARLILGLLINSKKKLILTGDSSLSKRDFSRVITPLNTFGANIISKNNSLPLKISGTEFLRPIKYNERLGSAQCKSAVMLAAIKTPGNTIIKAKKSRNHTELLFKYLKIPIKIFRNSRHDFINVRGLSNFKGFNYRVPSDISSCSFFLVLTLLSRKSTLKIKNVNINKTRTGVIEILNKMNSKIIFKNKRYYKGEQIADILVKTRKLSLKGINCPKRLNSSAIDEFLIIFLVAAKAKGISRFKDLGELNKKESPRLDIAVKFLRKLGIKVIRKNNDINIYGNPNLALKGKYNIKNFKKDHRVFMMSCIAALSFGGNWIINNPESVNTSFPEFLKKIKFLGGKIN